MSSVGDYEETNVREKKNKCDKFRRFLSYREHPIEGKTLDNDCPSIFCWYIRCVDNEQNPEIFLNFQKNLGCLL